ncbi:MAG: Dps family protein [Bacteroidales bacterium]
MLAEKLNELLAMYQVLYTNVRGFHWNIRGEKFFELHLKFEELYNDLNLKIDEIAERILTLGGTPEHRYSNYLKKSSIPEAEETADGTKDVEKILESLKLLLVLQREILDLSGDAGDEGTNSMMSDYIREQEKLAWMYRAYLYN